MDGRGDDKLDGGGYHGFIASVSLNIKVFKKQDLKIM
jgi:hypothetical protein